MCQLMKIARPAIFWDWSPNKCNSPEAHAITHENTNAIAHAIARVLAHVLTQVAQPSKSSAATAVTSAIDSVLGKLARTGVGSAVGKVVGSIVGSAVGAAAANVSSPHPRTAAATTEGTPMPHAAARQALIRCHAHVCTHVCTRQASLNRQFHWPLRQRSRPTRQAPSARMCLDTQLDIWLIMCLDSLWTCAWRRVK